MSIIPHHFSSDKRFGLVWSCSNLRFILSLIQSVRTNLGTTASARNEMQEVIVFVATPGGHSGALLLTLLPLTSVFYDYATNMQSGQPQFCLLPNPFIPENRQTRYRF